MYKKKYKKGDLATRVVSERARERIDTWHLSQQKVKPRSRYAEEHRSHHVIIEIWIVCRYDTQLGHHSAST